MKLAATVLAAAAVVSSCGAFTAPGASTRRPPAAFVTTSSPQSQRQRQGSTELYISSGFQQKQKKLNEPQDPEKKIAAYLKQPEPVAAKPSLGTTVLVSGFVKTKERTDQQVFDLLNHEDSAFVFKKIIAFVDDVKFARKRLLGRHARYTGLLDKLDFAEASEAGALPTSEQLEGVSSWVAYVGDDLDLVSKVAEVAQGASTVKNVAVLISDASSIATDDAAAAVQKLLSSNDDKSYELTIVAVGSLTEAPEGSVPYQIREFGTVNGTIPSDATMSRDESLRLVTECLALQCASNKAFSFTEVSDVNQTEYKLVKGLRECGYTRPQEIDHMITKGPEEYAKAIEDYKKRVPAPTQFDEWMQKEQEKREKLKKEREEQEKKELEARKQKEIEDIAREWAKREYFRKSMSGDVPLTEEEFIESVWDRALFEGDLKYRMLRGYDTDERSELEEFKKKQEKKKQVMLERAKAAMADLIEDEDDDGDAKSSADDSEKE